MKKVYSAANEVDAQLAKSFLDDAGVESMVVGAALSNIIGDIPLVPESLPGVWVRDEDEPAATAALERFRRPAPPEGQPWPCPNCGERIEPQFTECWNCGTRRPEGGGEMEQE